ncbi:MAG: hypothetical protein AABW51_02510 [Nanoarchaeota archaeon]
MIHLNKLVHDEEVFRVTKTNLVVHPEKIGEPKTVKIHRNYGEGLIHLEVWKLRESNCPDANGYTEGEFEDEAGKETRIASVQFYKY